MAKLDTREWLQQLPPTTIHSELYGTFEITRDGSIYSVSSFDPALTDGIAQAIFNWPGDDTEIIQYLRKHKIDRIPKPAAMQDFRWYVYYQTLPLMANHGLIMRTQSGSIKQEHLRDYAAYLILNGLPFVRSLKPPTNALGCSSEALHSITEYFETRLLFDASKKEGWQARGRCKFIAQVKAYLDRDLPIQMALPAFPCKTTNPYKAAATMPDGAEFEALCKLQTFCTHIATLHKPGCHVNVVSDGHVFSDCQGTDDLLVTIYNRQLVGMNNYIRSSKGYRWNAQVKFHGLGELLHPEPQDWSRELYKKIPSLTAISHPVNTRISSIHDMHRRLMLDIWSPPKKFFKDLVKDEPDHAITALFRGFSRFMFEDLAYHPNHINATVSQRKKVAENAAYTMIQRNQTYSRLVEAVFPNHVRLSIHAHDNAGPKFAVRILPWEIRYAEDALTLVNASAESSYDAEEASSRQTLHIPTPWHNTLADVYYHDDITKYRTFLIKAKSAVEVIENGWMKGGYDRHHPRGGRFLLWHKDQSNPCIKRGRKILWIQKGDFRLSQSLDITDLVRET